MSRTLSIVVVLGFMLATGPLLGQGASEQASTAELPDVALPPPLDRVLRDYERAWGAGDAMALASLFAEDGFVLQSNRPPIRGRAAIQAAYESQGGSPLRLRALAFASEDTLGYIIGAYRYGNALGDMGKFTLTLRRAPDGQWLIFSDMDNLSMRPLHRATPPSTSPAATRAED